MPRRGKSLSTLKDPDVEKLAPLLKEFEDMANNRRKRQSAAHGSNTFGLTRTMDEGMKFTSEDKFTPFQEIDENRPFQQRVNTAVGSRDNSR